VNPGVGWALGAVLCGVVIVLPRMPRLAGTTAALVGWICVALAVRAWGAW
jgi:hypothetical protein